MKTLVTVVGAVIFVGGIFLFLGNVIGFFRTFPLAGYGTMVLGGLVFKAGSKMGGA